VARGVKKMYGTALAKRSDTHYTVLFWQILVETYPSCFITR